MHENIPLPPHSFASLEIVRGMIGKGMRGKNFKKHFVTFVAFCSNPFL